MSWSGSTPAGHALARGRSAAVPSSAKAPAGLETRSWRARRLFARVITKPSWDAAVRGGGWGFGKAEEERIVELFAATTQCRPHLAPAVVWAPIRATEDPRDTPCRVAGKLRSLTVRYSPSDEDPGD